MSNGTYFRGVIKQERVSAAFCQTKQALAFRKKTCARSTSPSQMILIVLEMLLRTS